MAESRRYGLSTQLDIEQILLEAQHRWLRPAEICEILRNYQKFRIAPEPAHKPPSGSLFLFDRKVLRYFRKDGHNWRKKKDGKTVKEAHERLKAGSIDVLHCYYAHGEENENFQRRSYWLLEEDHSNIVLVHYREVKGNRANFNRIKEVEGAIPISPNSEGVLPSSEVDSSVSSRFNSYNHQVNSQTTDTASLNSTQASEYEDVESAYRHQTSSGLHSFLELQPRLLEKMEGGLPSPYYPVPFSTAQGHKGQSSVSTSTTSEPQKHLDFPSWEEILENSGSGIQSVPFQPSVSSNSQNTMVSNHGQGNELLTQLPADDGFGRKQEISRFSQQQYGWPSPEGVSSNASKWSTDGRLDQDSYHLGLEGVDYGDLFNSASSMHINLAEKDRNCAQNGFQEHLAYEGETALKLDVNNSATIEGKAEHCPPKQPLLDNFRKESLKKLDSFDRWMSKELGDVNESHMQSSSGSYWETVENEGRVDDSSLANQAHLDSYMLGPSLSQDQHFSIIDFSPNWAYAGSEIKVLITGKFLKSHEDLESCKWSCMFGEVEVPAEVIGDGVLRCHTPLHEAGRVPFYVTCSNRLACSEVREFEYRAHNFQDTDILDGYSGNTNEILLRMRFSKFLSLESASSTGSVPSSPGEDSHVSVEINSLLKEDNSEWEQMLNFPSEGDFSMEKVKDQLLQKLLKEKLRVWLLQKVAEGGKGASVLDEDGQGVLHFAAALGYDWAILPILAAGVNVNFRDVNGWTGLHWAAFYGRERTVGILITQGAAAGAVTDPTPACTTGQTPADLASSRGHKGIAGYLGESALSSHLYLLELKDPKEGDAVVQTVSERVATPLSDGDLPHGLSLKDSLAAVCNATQAAARIHQVFRVQSFQRKQQEFDGDKLETSEERLLSLAVKKSRLGRHDEPVQAAAVRIQNKFRSWKGRREFLTIRQQIVKIQAHVRGHQVRKNYRKIIWSVGILDKVILRWRRKGSGLRGFKKEPIAPAPIMEQATTSNDDDFDFLKEGRKQTEERLHKALARVKSMVQYPEARDQYRRLLNVVTEMQETKAVYEKVLNDTEETVDFDDDLIDLDALLGDDNDDTFMPTAI